MDWFVSEEDTVVIRMSFVVVRNSSGSYPYTGASPEVIYYSYC